MTVQGDLAFHAGDEIIVLEKTSQNWWTGRLRDGTTGVVPATFLMPKPKEEVQVRSSTFSTATMSPARTSQSVRVRELAKCSCLVLTHVPGSVQTFL